MNEMTPEFNLSGIVIDCKDARALGAFYQRLLGWTRISDDNGCSSCSHRMVSC